MKNKFFILCSHFFFLFFPSFSFLCLSPHCLSISSFFLYRPTDPSFFLRDPSPPTWPISASLLYFRHFGFVFRAVLVFRLCVSSCACVSGLFVFWAVIFLLSFFFFFTGFDGHGGLWLCNDFYGFDGGCGCVGGWMKYYFIVVFILFYCVKR